MKKKKFNNLYALLFKSCVVQGVLFFVRDHFGIVVLNPNLVLRKYKICNYCSNYLTVLQC